MSQPENHTLRSLREFREFSSKTDKSFAQIQERERPRRYATAEFEERLSALEERISALERRG